MIKMIVTDLDGTLLRDDKSVSEHTLDILRRCREAGIKIVYATGRGGSAERVAPAGLFDGKITQNGAIAVADGYNHQLLIPCEIARPLLIACDLHGIKISSDIQGMHYSNFDTSEVWPNVTNFEIVDFTQHMLDAETLGAVINHSDDAEFIEEHIPDELYLKVTNDGLGQVMHKDATKSKAIAALARHWGIDMPEITAFGDDLNDIDMLQACGIGVAMANALPEVKVSAQYLTASNEDDGVANWLAEHIL